MQEPKKSTISSKLTHGKSTKWYDSSSSGLKYLISDSKYHHKNMR